MKSTVLHAPGNIIYDTMPHPQIEKGTDAILKVSATATGGSNLVKIGENVKNLKKGELMAEEA